MLNYMPKQLEISQKIDIINDAGTHFKILRIHPTNFQMLALIWEPLARVSPVGDRLLMTCFSEPLQVASRE